MFQPIKICHHFLNIPSPAGKTFNIQAIGETINKAHKIGILIKTKINAVKILKRKVNIRTILKIRVDKVPKTRESIETAALTSALGNS